MVIICHDLVCSLNTKESAKAFHEFLSEKYPGFEPKVDGRDIFLRHTAINHDIRMMVLHMAIGFDWAWTYKGLYNVR